jgi:type IV pilus assembly protein PilE
MVFKKMKGFTLLEVMIAVALIGILAGIGIPSYKTYSLQGKLPEAHAALAGQRLKMEQSYQDNQTFVGACASGSSTALPASTARFSFACSSLTANTYTVTATGAGAMNGFVFTINQDNVKATTGAPAGWTTKSSCWVTSSSGC